MWLLETYIQVTLCWLRCYGSRVIPQKVMLLPVVIKTQLDLQPQRIYNVRCFSDQGTNDRKSLKFIKCSCTVISTYGASEVTWEKKKKKT